VRFFQAGNLKDLSAEDLDLLRKEISSLGHDVRVELESRQRSCAYCGQRSGDCLQGAKYCTAWHRYLDTRHDSAAPLSRAQFERRRAVRRLRVLQRPAADKPANSASNPAGAAGMLAALRKLKIRQILKEFRAITGQALRESFRSSREAGASGA
jgi:hypothetical protein